MNYQDLLFFTGLNFLYVLLNMLKSILLIKNNSKQVNAILSSITYGYYVLVIKAISAYDPIITIIGTIISNYIGTIGAMYVNDFLERNKAICVKITIDCNEQSLIDQIIDFCKTCGYGYNIVKKENDHKIYRCFSIYGKKGDKVLTNYCVRLKQTGKVKLHIENA